MGRLESLTSLALGRGPYEDGVIETTDGGNRPYGQQYSGSGRPRNPETKKREREHVRAANEVMQVTGIVEDSIAARIKANHSLLIKSKETLTGLRLMEAGRAVLVAGVWGVLGFRRRILLYKPYSTVGILELIKTERTTYSVDHLFFAGIPAVIAYHVSDWLAFFTETIVEALFEEIEEPSERQIQVKNILQRGLDVFSCCITLHFRLFAILQQLHLIPASKLFPGILSFVPFSRTSPLKRPPPLSLSIASLSEWAMALGMTATPLLIILVHGKIKFLVSRILYRPIYKTLPRPTGDSMFSGLSVAAPRVEYDTPDQDGGETTNGAYSGQDETTLRALEGLSTIDRVTARTVAGEGGRENSDDEDTEVTQAPLISFDVEATESIESSLGTWSAELRSANEPKVSKDTKYRVTGLTMLPPIMATESLREVMAGLLVLPLEAIMVRVIGRAYRQSGGLGVDDMWQNSPTLRAMSFKNLLAAFGIQVVVTGVVWAGFTLSTHFWAAGEREQLENTTKDTELSGGLGINA